MSWLKLLWWRIIIRRRRLLCTIFGHSYLCVYRQRGGSEIDDGYNEPCETTAWLCARCGKRRVIECGAWAMRRMERPEKF